MVGRAPGGQGEDWMLCSLFVRHMVCFALGSDLRPVVGAGGVQKNVCSHATRLAVRVSAYGHLSCDRFLGRFSAALIHPALVSSPD
jgi:hypothetical protein